MGGVVTVGIFEEDVTRTHNVSFFVPVDSKEGPASVTRSVTPGQSAKSTFAKVDFAL